MRYGGGNISRLRIRDSLKGQKTQKNTSTARVKNKIKKIPRDEGAKRCRAWLKRSFWQ